MKRYVRASKYDPELVETVPAHTFKISKAYINDTDVAERLYNLDPDFFETFAFKIVPYWKGGEPGKVLVIEVDVPINAKSGVTDAAYKLFRYPFKQSTATLSDSQLVDLLSRIKSDVINYYETRRARKQKKADMRASGQRYMTAQAFTEMMIKDRFGLVPSESYSDTHKSRYMLYDLPFTDGGVSYTDKAKTFAEEFQDLLDDLSAKYGFTYRTKFPTGGLYHRAAWEIYTHGDPVSYDKRTGVATVLTDY